MYVITKPYNPVIITYVQKRFLKYEFFKSFHDLEQVIHLGYNVLSDAITPL